MAKLLSRVLCGLMIILVFVVHAVVEEESGWSSLFLKGEGFVIDASAFHSQPGRAAVTTCRSASGIVSAAFGTYRTQF